ncbi:hypothetical protein Tco_0524976 [Tanacetum coccineum]
MALRTEKSQGRSGKVVFVLGERVEQGLGVQEHQCITKLAEAKRMLREASTALSLRVNAATKEVSEQTSFVPTIATWTGSYRSMMAWLPKPQSSGTKNPELGQEFPFDHGVPESSNYVAKNGYHLLEELISGKRIRETKSDLERWLFAQLILAKIYIFCKKD